MKMNRTPSAARVSALAGLALMASAAYAQPSNDTCATPTVVLGGVTAVSNVGATSDGFFACSESAFDVYYSYTATFSGQVQVDTCNNATFDTVVTVLDACGGTELACSDDFCGSSSLLYFEAGQGQTYIIRLASYGFEGGQTGTADLYVGAPLPTPIESIGFPLTNPIFPGISSVIQVLVTPGEFPESSGIAVTADTTAFQGGSPSLALNDLGIDGDPVAGDFFFSATLNVSAEEAPGTFTINYTVVDDQARESSSSFSLDVIPPPQYLESGDAGDLIANAQTPTGENPLGSLGGFASSGTDVDLFLINICDAANFGASTVNNSTFSDTQLFLFTLDGTGVTFNDQTEELLEQSTITSQFIPGNGNYYLAVNLFNVDPLDGAGRLIWADEPFELERQPDGPGALGSLASWEGDAFATGIYRVDFTGTCFPTAGNLCNYDYNQDENVDLTDAQLMAQVAAGIITADPSWLSGDMNGDENADLTDAQQLAAFVASGVCPI